MRPTGKLHLGHLEGALSNFLRLQEEYDSYFMVADWHALTTSFDQTDKVRENVFSMVADWLAVGVDPSKAVVFRQSQVLQHAELFTLLSMLTPVPWLERCPTYKAQQQEMPDKDLSSFGFLGYPLLQAADILAYKAELVPVGQDQLPHIEMTREIARRFNHLYGAVFPEPQSLLTSFPNIPGTDGRKMSKSYGNTVELGMEGAVLEQAVKSMYTDPQKVRRNDPGNPEGCVVYALHKLYTAGRVEQIARDCRSGALGCSDDKRELLANLEARLEPIRRRRKAIALGDAEGVIEAGNRRAREAAEATLSEVRTAMKL
jgi:tryptophanyl-tRNA synthetase